eukprot:6195749-Pleurochrysis_carterae.AAC.5
MTERGARSCWSSRPLQTSLLRTFALGHTMKLSSPQVASQVPSAHGNWFCLHTAPCRVRLWEYERLKLKKTSAPKATIYK